MAGIVVRRAKIVSDFVSQCQLRDFGRNATVVVDEGDDTRIKTAFGRAWVAGHVLRVDLVAFADSAGSARRRGDPSETQRSTREIPGSNPKTFVLVRYKKTKDV